MAGTKGKSGGRRTPSPGKKLGRPAKAQRSRAMLQVKVKTIDPDDNTIYLVGPEGLVWVQPTIGESHIVAARNEQERQAATLYISELLNMGLVPFGIPLNQRVTVAMFGGSPIRDCRWVLWSLAPTPEGVPENELPTQAGIVQ